MILWRYERESRRRK